MKSYNDIGDLKAHDYVSQTLETDDKDSEQLSPFISQG